MLLHLRDGKKRLCVIIPFPGDMDQALTRLKDHEPCMLAVYNARENLDLVIKNWEKLVKFKRHFSIYFVNPFSKLDKRWIIFPQTHQLVTDKAGLKPGLEALFITVDPVTKEEIEKVIATG